MCKIILFLFIISTCRYSKEEPFSVISVDIRNHSNLLDSLEQYVKGELLEGADAYHCEKCNKKVCRRMWTCNIHIYQLGRYVKIIQYVQRIYICMHSSQPLNVFFFSLVIICLKYLKFTELVRVLEITSVMNLTGDKYKSSFQILILL